MHYESKASRDCHKKIESRCDKTDKMLRHFYRCRSFPKLLSILYSRIFRHNELRCMSQHCQRHHLCFPLLQSIALRICSSSARETDPSRRVSGQVNQRGPDDPVPAVIDGGDYSKAMRAVSTKAAPSTTARTVATPASVELMRPRAVPAAPVASGWVITSFCRLDTRVTLTPGTGL